MDSEYTRDGRLPADDIEKHKKKDKKKNRRQEETEEQQHDGRLDELNRECDKLNRQCGELGEYCAELEQRCEELDGRYLRTLAEFDNFRKRTSREKAVMYDEGVKEAILKFLPVVDNFERALAAAAEDSISKGLGMIFKQMTDMMKGLGVEEIEAVGHPFDPEYHEAVMHFEDENLGAGEVAEEFQKGYSYKGKTVRFSMVKVAN